MQSITWKSVTDHMKQRCLHMTVISAEHEKAAQKAVCRFFCSFLKTKVKLFLSRMGYFPIFQEVSLFTLHINFLFTFTG